MVYSPQFKYETIKKKKKEQLITFETWINLKLPLHYQHKYFNIFSGSLQTHGVWSLNPLAPLWGVFRCSEIRLWSVRLRAPWRRSGPCEREPGFSSGQSSFTCLCCGCPSHVSALCCLSACDSSLLLSRAFYLCDGSCCPCDDVYDLCGFCDLAEVFCCARGFCPGNRFSRLLLRWNVRLRRRRGASAGRWSAACSGGSACWCSGEDISAWQEGRIKHRVRLLQFYLRPMESHHWFWSFKMPG